MGRPIMRAFRQARRPLIWWWRERGWYVVHRRRAFDGVTAPRLPGSIALILAHRDAATIGLCVRSFAPVVDRVLVCLDVPDDETRNLVTNLAAELANVSVMSSTPPDAARPAGWVEARNQIIAAARERFPDLTHVLMVDADDVLAWDRVDDVLRPILDGREWHVVLGITELLGDWVTTARGRTLFYDPCHVYWRGSEVDVHFTTMADAHTQIHVIDRSSGREIPSGRSRQVLFHAITAKPGDQLIRRAFMRPWLLAGRPGTLDDFAAGRAIESFPLPWPEGLLPSEYLVFNDQRRTDLRPLEAWERRLPPPVLADLRSGPRFRMDLEARRRSDREPPTELERRTYEALLAASRGEGQTPRRA